MQKRTWIWNGERCWSDIVTLLGEVQLLRTASANLTSTSNFPSCFYMREKKSYLKSYLRNFHSIIFSAGFSDHCSTPLSIPCVRTSTQVLPATSCLDSSCWTELFSAMCRHCCHLRRWGLVALLFSAAWWGSRVWEKNCDKWSDVI